MSDDLVVRLEHLARKMESFGQYDDWSRVVREALDEIDRLRSELYRQSAAANRLPVSPQ